MNERLSAFFHKKGVLKLSLVSFPQAPNDELHSIALTLLIVSGFGSGRRRSPKEKAEHHQKAVCPSP
jgi:hypothetical protein